MQDHTAALKPRQLMRELNISRAGAPSISGSAEQIDKRAARREHLGQNFDLLQPGASERVHNNYIINAHPRG